MSEEAYSDDLLHFSESASTDDGESVINLGIKHSDWTKTSMSSSYAGDSAGKEHQMPIFFNPCVNIGIPMSSYQEAKAEIENDQDHIVLLVFCVMWSLPAQKTAENIYSFSKRTNQPVKCFFLDEDTIYDECTKLNIVVGTPVVFLFYQSKRILVHRTGRKPTKRIVGALNGNNIREIVTSCIAMSKHQQIFEIQLTF